MRKFLSLFTLHYPETLTYMLQSTEYQPDAYLVWFKRVKDFSSVMYRRKLDKTKSARLLLWALRAGMCLQFMVAIYLILVGLKTESVLIVLIGTFFAVSYPLVWAYLIIIPLIIGRIVIVNPRNHRLIKESENIFREHKGLKIAVAGSYGKTSIKELLLTVLSVGKKVSATPANKNVALSHALFAKKLKGDEDILIIEYGEGAPGDVEKFSNTTHPNIGVITGLAPAHLDKYSSIESAGQDIFTLAKKVGANNVYVNIESEAVKPFMKPMFNSYSSEGVLGWKIQDIKVAIDGLSFSMKNGKQQLKLKSGLLGRHQIGPLALVAALSIKLGLNQKQVEEGISKTRAFEHRMQPRLLNGAWLLDDTYNGNIDGMIAGLRLMKELTAKRKIYVTPGLVDQGKESVRVHNKLGEEIAKTNPDKVILMKNSTTEDILSGINKIGFNGEIQIEQDPLEFYTNIEHIIAYGDLVLMQNDWLDNYN